jgi:hypothetical protein
MSMRSCHTAALKDEVQSAELIQAVVHQERGPEERAVNWRLPMSTHLNCLPRRNGVGSFVDEVSSMQPLQETGAGLTLQRTFNTALVGQKRPRRSASYSCCLIPTAQMLTVSLLQPESFLILTKIRT